MAPLTGCRNLTCFYCGFRTSTRYEPRMKQFACPVCDATNFLDQNGDITDPPVAKTSRNPDSAVRYIKTEDCPLPTDPKTSAMLPDAIFCDKCLKNQHLLTASLAQYLPDTDDPEYKEREKRFYRWRRNLEQLYPQICSQCEPKVRERMDQSAYMAKTDLLRRMIDRTNENRHPRRRDGLDRVATLGRWLWVGGFLLQLAWHSAMIHVVVTANQGIPFWAQRTLDISGQALDFLPAAEKLVKWSLYAAFLSSWWNPRFIQTYRGFTRRINGLPKWYAQQGVIVLVRMAFLWTPEENRELSEPNVRLMGHLFAASLAVSFYVGGPRLITTDTSPLFGPSPREPSDPCTQLQKSRQHESRDRNMSEILDEIMNGPPPSPVVRDDYSERVPPLNNQTTFPSISPPSLSSRGGPDLPLSTLSSLAISSAKTLPSEPSHYDREMDWSPTQSKHRAFNTKRALLGFGQAPVEERTGPFWYRGLPPAPTSLARRTRNPPNQLRLRQTSTTNDMASKTKALTPSIFKSSAKTATANTATDASEVHFAQPSFFSPPPRDDPRDPLSDMFGTSFSLNQEEREKDKGGWLRGFGLKRK